MSAVTSLINPNPCISSMRSGSGARKSCLKTFWNWGFLGPILCLLMFCNLSLAAEVPASQQEAQESQEAGVSVLGVFTVMLVVGVASYHVLTFTRIPYTAILIVRLSIWHGR